MRVKVLVIHNPTAGVGRAETRVQRLVRALEARGHAVECVTTRGPGEARHHAGEREGRVECIVAAGGDGTLNEVVNGLAVPAQTPLFALALGTANMLARQLRLPTDPERVANVIENGTDLLIDACNAGGMRFLSVAGVGFDAMVTATIRSRGGKAPGYRGYALPIASTFRLYRAPRFRFRLDRGPPRPCAFVLLSKLPNYGGVLRVSPGARLDAGSIDVCIFHKADRRHLLAAVAPAFAGRLAMLPWIECARAAHLRFESEVPVPVQLDGDHRGTTPLEVTVEPATVLMRVPS